MNTAQAIIQEASALPIDERVSVVDSLLRTLDAPEPEIDAAWLAVAQRRLSDLRSGRVQSVPGPEVFARIFAPRAP